MKLAEDICRPFMVEQCLGGPVQLREVNMTHELQASWWHLSAPCPPQSYSEIREIQAGVSTDTWSMQAPNSKGKVYLI